jgi:hypothetical protein
MEYFQEVLDRGTGELTTISKGNWITVSELADLYGVGPREARTILREMGVLVVEGTATHARHRLASWTVGDGWGQRIERRGKVPFDSIGPELRKWIEERWAETRETLAAEMGKTALEARGALSNFNATRLYPLRVQEAIDWLAVQFPRLTQREVGLVLGVTQQLVSKYQRIRLRRLAKLNPALVPDP